MTCYRTVITCSPSIAARSVLHRGNLRYVKSVPIQVDSEATFSTPDAARMAGVSFRQLDYWSRVGVIVPETPAAGSGSARQFTGTQVRNIAMIGRLRELGVSLEAIEDVMKVVDRADGALIVIGSASVRVASPADVADAVADAEGAAVVVSPSALRLLTAPGRKRAVRHAAYSGRLPASRPRA